MAYGWRVGWRPRVTCCRWHQSGDYGSISKTNVKDIWFELSVYSYCLPLNVVVDIKWGALHFEGLGDVHVRQPTL